MEQRWSHYLDKERDLPDLSHWERPWVRLPTIDLLRSRRYLLPA